MAATVLSEGTFDRADYRDELDGRGRRYRPPAHS